MRRNKKKGYKNQRNFRDRNILKFKRQEQKLYDEERTYTLVQGNRALK